MFSEAGKRGFIILLRKWGNRLLRSIITIICDNDNKPSLVISGNRSCSHTFLSSSLGGLCSTIPCRKWKFSYREGGPELYALMCLSYHFSPQLYMEPLIW